MNALQTSSVLKYWRPILLVPVAQLVEDPGDASCFSCLGDDPQFHVVLPEGGVLAGWYRVVAGIVEVDGQLQAPCFYPDYGDGISEAGRIDLTQAPGTAAIDAIIHFPSDVASLRFDPSVVAAVFRLGGFQLMALSAAEAAWHLIGVTRRSGHAREHRTTLQALARRDGDAERMTRLMALRARAYAEDRAYPAWKNAVSRATAAATAQSLFAVPKRERVRFSILFCPGVATADATRALESVLAQSESDYEILLTAEESQHWGAYLDEGAAAQLAERARCVAPSPPSAPPIARINEARGEYIVVVDAADTLASDALAVFDRFISSERHPSVLYCDEEIIVGSAAPVPYFKPAWDPELFANQDYVARSAVFDVALARATGWQDLDTSAWHYELLCRMTERLQEADIRHLPRMLRTVRTLHGSTTSPFAPTADVEAGTRRAMKGRAGSRVPDGYVTEFVDGRVRTHHPIPEGTTVDIIVPTRDQLGVLSTCISSVLSGNRAIQFRLNVVDNGSEEPATLDYLAGLGHDPRVRVLAYPFPFNYSAINNFAVAHCDGDVVLFLNNDVEAISADWMEELVSHAVRPGIGAVGAMLYYPDNSIQHAGVLLGPGGVAAHAFAGMLRGYRGQHGRAALVQRVSAVTAACLAVKRSAFHEIGGFDESLAVAFNDVDLCLRLLAAGYCNLWTPHAELYHHESASRGQEDNPVKQARFAGEVGRMRDRWDRYLDDDPAYSPNLSLAGEPFAIDPSRYALRMKRTVFMDFASYAAPPSAQEPEYQDKHDAY